jgi:hypothetical protein
VKRKLADVRAHEHRAVTSGSRPGWSHLRQVDVGGLPAGSGEIACLGAQAAAGVKRTPAWRQPAIAEHRERFRRRPGQMHV